MIARDGIPWLVVSLLAAAVSAALGVWPLSLLLACLFAFFLNFFRDPERHPASGNPRELVSPADGVVVRVDDLPGDQRPPGCEELPRLVSIFMNVFDVHVNRSPLEGTIRSADHRPGRKVPADRAEARLENERVLVVLDTDHGPVAFAQVAGLVARRIVFRRHPGEKVRRGERVGLIKFGSRVDIYLPVTAEVLVSEGDRCRAGESLVARMPELQ